MIRMPRKMIYKGLERRDVKDAVQRQRCHQSLLAAPFISGQRYKWSPPIGHIVACCSTSTLAQLFLLLTSNTQLEELLNFLISREQFGTGENRENTLKDVGTAGK